MKKLFVLLAVLTFTLRVRATVSPVDLRCEYMSGIPLIDVLHPRLSWIPTAVPKDDTPEAYEIQVASSLSRLLSGKADLWQTGKVSKLTNRVVYQGAPLPSMGRCYWRMRLWNARGKASAWSKVAQWQMGMLRDADWTAHWIGAPWETEEAMARDSDKTDKPAPLLRKDFDLSKPVRSAYVFVSGLGYYELWLNGCRVGHDYLTPNQTDYSWRPDIERTRVAIENQFTGYRVLYNYYDVTSLLRQGRNALGCILGNGFFNVVYADNFVLPYGSPRLKLQLRINYADGTSRTVVSDTTWKARKSWILKNGIFTGEEVDGRLYDADWCTPLKSTAQWLTAVERKAPDGKLEAQTSVSDCITAQLSPRSIKQLGEGHYLVDFGEEISGWVHLKQFKGKRGDKIDIRYICDQHLGTNTYIMSGNGLEDYHARFTWFVFSKVEIKGWPGELSPRQIAAEAVNAPLRTTTDFACSDTLLNHIQHIWKRSLLDNAHGGIFSDCPHRERAAYTGDGQVTSSMVMQTFDARAYYVKWLRDIMLAQNPHSGNVPNGAPWQPGDGGGPAWGAAICVMPYNYYLQYADSSLLATCYKSMTRQVDFFSTWADADGVMLMKLKDKANPGMDIWHQLGEWCTPTDTMPDRALVHTYVYWRCIHICAQAARVLGLKDDAAKWTTLEAKVRQAFTKRFYNANTRSFGPAGSNIFALSMGVPDSLRPILIDRVREEAKAHANHLTTGIFGTRLLFETLSDNGLTDLALEMLDQTTFPSFGWWIAQGATTTWEQWNGQASRNHPMFGGGLVWLYSRLAGLRLDDSHPMSRHFVIRPCIPKKMQWVKFSRETVYGRLTINWHKEGDKVRMQVTLPSGCSADVYVPEGQGYAKRTVLSGTHSF